MAGFLKGRWQEGGLEESGSALTCPVSQRSNFAAEPREFPMQEALNAMPGTESDSEERKGEFVSFEGSPFQLFQP
ncbi:MAG TPA: hypothetical protein VNM48_18180, partial [Chloroflexota bacterium]|nr:hypothetical protein [Chloroflexota bacterium]